MPATRTAPTAPAELRRFTAATVVDALGSGVWLPFALLFLVHGQGIPLVSAGAALGVGALVGIAAGPAAGVALDRIGPRAVLIAGNAAGLAAYCLYPLVTAAWQVGIVAAVAASGDRLFWTGNAPMVATLTEGRDAERVLGTQMIARFAGAGLGATGTAFLPAVTGPLVFHLLAYANAATYAVALALVLRLPPGSAATRAPGTWATVLRDRPYVGFCATHTAFALASASKYAILPILVRDVLHGPQWISGAAIAAGTAVVVFGQRPAVLLLRRRPRGAGLVAAAALFACGFAALATVTALPLRAATVLIIAASLVFAAAEATFAPLSAAAAAAAAPPTARGRASALFQLSWGAASVLAPVLTTTLLAAGNAVLWLTLAACCLAAVPALRRLDHALPPGVLSGAGPRRSAT